jgi:hypothetical protein
MWHNEDDVAVTFCGQQSGDTGLYDLCIFLSDLMWELPPGTREGGWRPQNDQGMSASDSCQFGRSSLRERKLCSNQMSA